MDACDVGEFLININFFMCVWMFGWDLVLVLFGRSYWESCSEYPVILYFKKAIFWIFNYSIMLIILTRKNYCVFKLKPYAQYVLAVKVIEHFRFIQF